MRAKKRINFRLPFAMALAMVCGIAFTYLIFRENGQHIFLFVPVLIILTAYCFVAAFAGTKTVVYYVCVALAFAVGLFYSFGLFVHYYSPHAAEGAAVNITGTSESVGTTAGGYNYVIVTDARLNGENLDGKVVAYFKEGDYVDRGYKVKCYARFDRIEVFSGGNLQYLVTEGVKYVCTVNGRLDADEHFSPFASVYIAIKDVLYANTDPDTAAVCIAMLTGDSHGVSDDVMATFRYGGIAHVFAVSGLHIGVLYSALTWLFRRLRVKRTPSIIVRLSFIFLYSGVCGFTPSSLRAAIMCTVSAFAGFVQGKYDSLNGLSVAVMIILLINPLMLFDIGFILSVCAVLGILLLSHNMARLFKFLPSFIGEALSISLSAQLVTFPVLLACFGYVSAAGMILNVAVLPLLSALYIALFVCVILSLILPFAAFIFVGGVTLPFAAFLSLSVKLNLEGALIYASAGAEITACIFVLVAGMTDKINYKGFLRAAVVCVGVLSVVMYAVKPNNYSYGHISVSFTSGSSGAAALIKTDGGIAAIVTEDYLGTGVKQAAISYFGAEPDALIIIGGDGALSQFFNQGCTFKQVYVCGGAFHTYTIGGKLVEASDSFLLYDVEYAFTNGDLNINCGGENMKICTCGSCFNGALTLAINPCGWTGNILYTGAESINLNQKGSAHFQICCGEIMRVSR